MCGIAGLYAPKGVAEQLVDALTMLQHRGQDAAGIATMKEYVFSYRKKRGLVCNVFRQPQHLNALQGNFGIAHVRYTTSGDNTNNETQPFYVNSPYGITLVHNGNLTNKIDLFQQFISKRHINSNSDSELLLNVLAESMQHKVQNNPQPEDIFAAVAQVHKQCEGAFSVVAMIAGQGMLVFRDQYGIRPLAWGSREIDGKSSYLFASESTALCALGYTHQGDVPAGAAMFIDMNGTLHRRQIIACEKHSPCAFEYIYLAKPETVIANVSVYSARRNMGIALGKQIKKKLEVEQEVTIDTVMPIPDTSRVSALEVARVTGIPYSEGLIKNHYIGRTFIMNKQRERLASIRRKFQPVHEEFRGKSVLLVDDSIVRGNTAKIITQMVRDAGAKKVYIASAAPRILYRNIYGIDTPSQKELIAYNQSVQDQSIQQFCQDIGCDGLIFQELDALKESILQENSELHELDCSVFDGKYVTGEIDEAKLDEIEKSRCSFR